MYLALNIALVSPAIVHAMLDKIWTDFNFRDYCQLNIQSCIRSLEKEMH